MGAKSVFKRHKNPVYLTCCIIIGLLLSGCQHYNLLRTQPTPIDTNEKKYLDAIQKFVMEKDYPSAAKENQYILEYYSRISDTDDIILSNYIQNARIISDLLTQITEDQKKKQALYEKNQLSEEQIKELVLVQISLENKTEALKKEVTDMDLLAKKNKILEIEKKLLQNQIDRLKEIDLNPDKILENPEPAETGHPVDE